jgi:hypothetical protein
MNITKQLHAAIWITLGVILVTLAFLAIPFGLVMLNIVVFVVVAIGLGWLGYWLWTLWSNAIAAQKRSNVHRTGGSRY